MTRAEVIVEQKMQFESQRKRSFGVSGRIFCAIALSMFCATLSFGFGVVGAVEKANSVHDVTRIIDLEREADRVMFHPKRKIGYILSSSQGAVTLFELRTQESALVDVIDLRSSLPLGFFFFKLLNLDRELAQDLSVSAYDFAIDSAASKLYVIGEIDYSALIERSNFLSKLLQGYQGPLVSSVIYQIDLESLSVRSTLLQQDVSNPRITADRESIYVGEANSSVVIALSVEQAFPLSEEAIEKSAPDGQSLAEGVEIDPSRNIFVGDATVAELGVLEEPSWLIISEADRRSISIFETASRERVARAFDRKGLGVGSPLAIHISGDSGRLLFADTSQEGASLSVYDLNHALKKYDPMVTVTVGNALGIERRLEQGTLRQPQRSALLLDADRSGDTIAVGSLVGQAIAVFSRYKNSLERINVIPFDGEVRDVAVSSEGQRIVAIVEEGSQIAIVDNIDTWVAETVALQGDAQIRAAQKVLATCFAESPKIRPNVIDGFFGQETNRAATALLEAMGADFDLDTPGGREAAMDRIVLRGCPDPNEPLPEISEPILPEDQKVKLCNVIAPDTIRIIAHRERASVDEFVIIYACEKSTDRFDVQIDTYLLDISNQRLKLDMTQYASCSYFSKQFDEFPKPVVCAESVQP